MVPLDFFMDKVVLDEQGSLRHFCIIPSQSNCKKVVDISSFLYAGSYGWKDEIEMCN